MRYFMQVFINSVESLNHPVYSAPPCTSGFVVGVIFVHNRSGKHDASLLAVPHRGPAEA